MTSIFNTPTDDQTKEIVNLINSKKKENIIAALEKLFKFAVDIENWLCLVDCGFL